MNKFKFLFICTFLIIFSFPVFAQKTWKKALNDVYVWTDIKTAFTWSGSSVGETYKLANGKGSIITDSKRNSCELYYGAFEKDFNTTTDGKRTKYLCESQGINGFGIVIRDNGMIYCGVFNNGKINGRGDLYKDWNLIYAGEITNNKQNGEGIEYQKNSTLTGHFENGLKNGLFVVITSNGKKIEVNYNNNQPDRNNCKITYADETHWIGSVDENFEPKDGQRIEKAGTVQTEKRVAGKLEGNQTQKYPDNSIYEGEFSDGKRNGYGVMTYANGMKYSGDWENDCQEGYGTLIIDEKSYYTGYWSKSNNKQSSFYGEGLLVTPSFTYDGEWTNGKKNGYGTLSISNATYEGAWKNDVIEGDGLIIFEDDSYYEGAWKNNKRNGYGEYVWATGDVYFGDWKNDIPDGIGYIALSNGDSYSGEFENGTYSGEGIYTWKNGDRYEGIFDNNVRTKLGTYYYANGNIYEGEFKNNKPEGKGKFYFKNGSHYEGNFHDGKLYGKGDLFIPYDDDYIILTSELWTGNNAVPPKGIFILPDGSKTPVVRNENGELIPDETITSSENYKKIKKGIEITQTVLGIVNLAATVCEFVPCPPVQVVAKAVDTICDVTDLALSVAHAGMATAEYNNDKAQLKKYGASEDELALLKKNYEKEIRGDVITVALTGTLMGVQAVKTARNADKALEIYPEFQKSLKAIDKIGETTEIAKSTKKFSNGLIRTITTVAYGKTGSKLIKKYGDDAAKLLFKYGDNAFNALVSNGDIVVRLAKNSEHAEELLSEVFKHGDKAIKSFTKYGDDAIDLIAKHGKTGLKLLDEYADDLVKQYAKHGEDIVILLEKVGGNTSKNGKMLLKTIWQNSDDVYSVIVKTAKNTDNPRDFNRVIRYLDAFGDNGIKDIKKWSGVVPENISYRQIQLWKRINSSATRKLADKMKQLPGITLSKAEMDMCFQDARQLRQLIMAKTGKSFRNGYQEFFIRMKIAGNAEQISKLWDSSNVKNFIKNEGIRAGGVHEWIMAKNFEDFLTNPKWGDDGEYLTIILEKLVQKTENVKFKNGGYHGGDWSATFHNRLSEVIASCDNASEVFEKVNKFAKEVLSTDSYEEFYRIFYGLF